MLRKKNSKGDKIVSWINRKQIEKRKIGILADIHVRYATNYINRNVGRQVGKQASRETS